MKFCIISGGRSSEREVSFSSAKNIQKILGIPDDLFFDYPDEKEIILEKVNSSIIVIPIVHGKGGEDGEIQKWLQEKNITYLFSSPETHLNALDKRRAKELVAQKGITYPREYQPDNLHFPLVVKPNDNGSSFSVAIVYRQGDVPTNFKDFLIEEYITGREFSIGVIEKNGKIEALPIIEIIPKNTFFDYESKYNADSLAQEICPANISKELTKELQGQAIAVHRTLECTHISRSDFIVTPDGKIYFLEINTIPGMTPTSLIMKEIEAAGYSVQDLFKEWGENI